MRILPIIIVCAFLIGCNVDKDNNNAFEEKTAIPSEESMGIEREASMRSRIEKAYAGVNAQNLPYHLSREKARMIKSRADQMSGLQKLELQIQYAGHSMNAGLTEEAIKTYEEIIPLIEQNEINNKDQILFELKKRLGVAYLRLGEQQNCLGKHNPASCIIPIAPEGQHQLKMGSESAIRVFSDILEKYPGNLEIIYLLNLAYMTIGGYPEKVPNDYLMEPSVMMPMNDFVRFPDIAPELGLDKDGLSGGICVDDFNNDGYLDIIASSWGFTDPLVYFQNMGNGTFKDMSTESGLDQILGGLNLQHADYNNDGHMDFLVLRGAWMGTEGTIPNSLVRNNGDGTFTDITLEAGIYSEKPTQTAAWADFNLDGKLDLFIGNEGAPGMGMPCELFMNLGNGKFKDIAPETGLNFDLFVKGVTAGDVNNDGYPDIYLSVFQSNNILLLNNADPDRISFRDITNFSGVSEPIASFPTWMFDYNNDGNLDIYVSSYMMKQESAGAVFARSVVEQNSILRPRLYKNMGDGTFQDVSLTVGLKENTLSMGSNYGDINNDGYADFYLGTGEPQYSSIVPNKMYLNKNGERFIDVTYSGGFGNIQKGHAVGFGDFDLDGDQDIYTVIGGAFQGDNYYNSFYENPGMGNNWVIIRLEGTKSNRAAIGALIIIDILENGKKRQIYHSVNTGSSFGGNSLQAELGIGKANKIESMRVIWPFAGRPQDLFFDLPANKIIKIVEGLEKAEIVEPKAFEFKGGE
jgi:hypothetical protein